MDKVRTQQQSDHDAIALRAEREGISTRLKAIDALIVEIAKLPDLKADRDTLFESLATKRIGVLKVEQAQILSKKSAAITTYLTALNNGWDALKAWGKGEALNGRFALVQDVIDAEEALRDEESEMPLVKAALAVIDVRGQLGEVAKKIRKIGTYQTIETLKAEKQGLIIRQAEIEENLKPTSSWRRPLLIAAVALVALVLLAIYSDRITAGSGVTK